MGVKIVELSAANAISDSDLLPTSQFINNTRDTYKVTVGDLETYVNYSVNTKLTELEGAINANYINPAVFNTFVKLSGDTMTGNLDLNGNNTQNFSANIVEYTDSITLSSGHNGYIILMNRPVGVGETDPKAIVTIADLPVLPNGFNVMIIQIGDSKVKIVNSGAPTAPLFLQSDGALYTRKKYSQINVCVLSRNPYLVWLSGDMV